jgi:UDP-N-acetylglucosamine--N-acetylmuramyl-(pentapeptide) pyrophosphoryl-undecaprenol N-acetylglucosamine transferase
MDVVIAGGGTAGHVNPALALARCLTGDSVTFVGTDKGVEARLVPEQGFAFRSIEVAGFDRAKPWRLPAVGLRALSAVTAARSILKDVRPQVVVGVGGYVSLPVTLAARSLRIPFVLHEQNVVLGLANKVSKRWARSVAVSFAKTLEEAGQRGVHTGNPVLPELVSTDVQAARRAGFDSFELDPARRTLLVFGGSLGAKRVNDAAAGLATEWADRSDVQVLHITGRSQFDPISEAVRKAPVGALVYRVVPYVERMAEAYAVADLALCRGGATTVAELGVLGVPSIVVPYPHHRDRQQERHGRILESAGAARVLLDADTTTASVATLVEEIFGDEGTRKAMAAAALSFGIPDAAERLAAVVREASA